MRVGIHNVRFDFPRAPGSIAPTLAATARGDPVAYVERVGNDIIPRLGELDPPG